MPVTKELFEIEGRALTLTNLDKVYFPAINATKAELIEYYLTMAPYILPYLKNRPFSMLHYPHGVEGETFFQKQRPDDAPDWLGGVRIPSHKKTIDWCLVNDAPSLIYMVNRSCLETHAWFSRVPNIEEPDVAIFDIDPSGSTGFSHAVEGALLIKAALEAYGLFSIPKTSGKTGVHVVVPIEPTPFEQARKFLTVVCKAIERIRPELFTTERIIKKRGDRVYLDAVQNARGKTLPSPYSVRSTPSASVSTPLTWAELERGVTPEQFHIRNIPARIKEAGDLFAPAYATRQILPEL